MAQSSPTTPPRRLLRLALLMLALLAAAACVFENELDDQRCLNDSACTTRFGEEYRCVEQVCQPIGPRDCSLEQDPDLACQTRDGFFCNGLETCSPDAEGADAFGCVPGPVPGLDDGVACTVDLCDESRPSNQRIIHDPSACECQGDEVCRALFDSPCETAACHPNNFNCVVTRVEAGTSCEDGIACTTGTTCDEEGACVAGPGNLSDAACSDDVFCNGAEICDPEAAGADPATGCIPGSLPTAAASAEDGIACTLAVCSEATKRVNQDPRSCECATAADCEARFRDCRVYRCDASTNFTCEATGVDVLPEGTPCDDGVTCTAQDTCDVNGLCVGTRTDRICASLEGCEAAGTPTCDPDALDVDPSSGCTCAP